MEIRRYLSAKRMWAIFLSLLSFFILFGIDHVGESKGITDDNPSAPLYKQILSSGFWYQFAVTGGFRKPESSHVALVLIREPSDVISSACLERAFVADLIRTLTADYGARVIVLDLYFSPGRCSQPEATGALEQSVRDLPNKTAIVYGRAAYTEVDLTADELKRFKSKDFQMSDLILKDSVLVEAPPRVTEGLVQLNQDIKRIPLGWYTYSSKQGVGVEPRQYKDTLAVAAVRANDPENPFIKDLRDWKNSGKDPFTSFLPAGVTQRADGRSSGNQTSGAILLYSALDLICSGSHKTHPWNCPEPDSKANQSLVNLGSRVVVVGLVDPDQDPDIHPSPIGRVPGAVLQANYIESLLDHRYFKRVDTWLEMAIALAWFWVIDRIFKVNSSRPGVALLYNMGVNILVWVLLYNILILEIGYYISLAVPGFLMIAARYIWTLEIQRHRQHAVVPARGK